MSARKTMRFAANLSSIPEFMMTPEQMRALHPLISTAPKYWQYLAAKAAREIVQRLLLPMAIVSAAIAGYRDEMNHMLAADPIYLGPGK